MFLSKVKLRNDISDTEKFSLLEMTAGGKHNIVWQLFLGDTEKKRDFLFREDNGVFMVLSKEQPTDTRNMFNIQTKPYSLSVNSGELLSFSLRANPVTTIRDKNGKRSKADVVTHAIVSDEFTRGTSFNDAAQTVIPRWLGGVGERNEAFELLDSVVFYRKGVQSMGKRRKSQKAIVDVTGTIRVRDSDSLKDLQMLGVGSGKSFGNGLFLFRR